LVAFVEGILDALGLVFAVDAPVFVRGVELDLFEEVGGKRRKTYSCYHLAVEGMVMDVKEGVRGITHCRRRCPWLQRR